MGEYAFSKRHILYTTGAATCVVIVARKDEVWGLYHDVVYPKSRNWVYGSHHERLVYFLEKIRGAGNERKSDFAFLFGANQSISEKIVGASRIEAERALVEIGGFKKAKVVSRWNNDQDRLSSVYVLIDPVSRLIYTGSVLR